MQVLIAGCVLGWSLTVLVVRADGLEPETGVFAGYGPPDPYDLLLRRTLLQDDNYRLCQMVTIPSFFKESAVYMLRQSDGTATVVSRTLKSQLWGKMQKRIQKASKDPDSYSLGAESQAAALQGLIPKVESHIAPLDSETAALLADTCRAVLLQVHHIEKTSTGFDGTTYHAGHWVPGAFLSGTTWSPKEGTIASEFVAMEEVLKSFADSPFDRRDAIRADLISKATRLGERVAPPK